MSNWDEFKKKEASGNEAARPAGKAIEGNFICQFCFKYVDDGTYYPIDSVLKWVCEDGHVNFAENFKLG